MASEERFNKFMATLEKRGHATRNGQKFKVEERKVSYNRYIRMLCHDFGDGIWQDVNTMDCRDSIYNELYYLFT